MKRMEPNPNMSEESGGEIKGQNNVMSFDRKNGGDEQLTIQLTKGHHTRPNSAYDRNI